jgi:hypothetical protein
MRNGKVALAILLLIIAVAVKAMTFGQWSPAVSVESVPGTDVNFNTTFQDGCPAPSKDGLLLYMASNRPGGAGGLDIWVSTRESADDPWGAPTNLGEPINTPADEFCPTPLRDGHGLLFVSTKPGGCGGSDIYFSRRHVNRGWEIPEHLGCQVNSSADEASPFFVESDEGSRELYFSSTRPGGFAADPPGATTGDSDIYVSPVLSDGSFGVPTLVNSLNTASQDARPNVRRDGREIFFDSNRPGGFGLFDVWTATRVTPSDPWSIPENVGANVNSVASETRPFLSWGATTLYVGSTRVGGEGAADIYVSQRERQNGPQ